jgi:adenylate cyclase
MLFIPIAVGAVFALLGLFDFWRPLEYRLYDVFLHLKPAVKESSSIVLLDVDEDSIVKAGSWPWPRGLMAQGLETLAEFGAEFAVFDIEYIEKSPMSVDRSYLENGLKSEFDSVFDDIGSNIGGLFGSLANGSVKLSDAKKYGEQLVEIVGEGKGDLYQKAAQVAIENDSYLGKAMRLFGNAFVTINLQLDKIEPPVASRSMAERFAYPKVEASVPLGTEKAYKDFIPPIPEVTSMAKGAGITNVPIDSDGTRRRIRLVEEIDGKYYLQLALAPLAQKLGNPEVVYEGSRLLLKGALVDGKRQDISIPLDDKGNMLIRWPKKKFNNSFAPHLPFYRLLEYRDNEDALVQNLKSLRDIEVWALVQGANPVDRLISDWDASEAARKAALAAGTADSRSAWLAAKETFKSDTAAFIAQGYDASVPPLVQRARALAPAADRPLYDDVSARFSSIYGNCANAIKLMDEEASRLRAQLSGAYCIIGWTAHATTDLGANPFDEKFVNVGTHAAIANGILQRDFLSEAPRWVGSLAALMLAFAVVLLVSRLSTVWQILVGLGATAFVLVVCYGVFHFWGVFVSTLGPTLSTLLSFLSYSLVSFIVTGREKDFLRKAFGTYLSEDVIDEIVADPSMLKLGGQKKWITAIFTDVRGFSTISEALDPEQLVTLLNLYLSGMSDIILQNRGTIDKYEGDAIISFFGAPVTNEFHAKMACRAAVLMKKKEAELNERFLAERMTPNPLVTRIGINTGDMVVGNMGTEKKMNYTMMGNAVNLAARLEGVNKQYGSWILASDATKAEAGDEFLFRPWTAFGSWE